MLAVDIFTILRWLRRINYSTWAACHRKWLLIFIQTFVGFDSLILPLSVIYTCQLNQRTSVGCWIDKIELVINVIPLYTLWFFSNQPTFGANESAPKYEWSSLAVVNDCTVTVGRVKHQHAPILPAVHCRLESRKCCFRSGRMSYIKPFCCWKADAIDCAMSQR